LKIDGAESPNVTLGLEDSLMAKWYELDYEENVKDLEALIDGNKLREVVLALVTIASGKADHLHKLAGR
jgi:hypothetical protein